MYNPDEHGFDPQAFEARDPKGKLVKVAPADLAIYLRDPKYPHNLGQSVRACSCFGVPQLWWSGQRTLRELKHLTRIPREERMRGYADVSILHSDDLLDRLPRDVVPVAIELRPGSEPLQDFIHPEKALYVFGPEDGSIDKGALSRCHRFVVIPSAHCFNLSMAVGIVLYDRQAKALRAAERAA